MSKKLPYEEELNRQLQNIPLPDSNLSWQKMEAMLDEKEKKRRIVPFFFRNVVGIIVLLFTVGVGAWLLFKPATNNNKIDRIQFNHQNTSSHKNVASASSQEKKLQVENNTIKENNEPAAMPDNATNTNQNNIITKGISGNQLVLDNYTTAKKNNRQNTSIRKQGNTKQKNASSQNNNKDAKQETFLFTENSDKNNKAHATQEIKATADDENNNNIAQTSSATKETITNIAVQENIAENNTTDSTFVREENNTVKDSIVETKLKNKKNNSIKFSVGIALQQQIPIAKQSAVNYNYNGGTNILSDYIPAVYIRAYKKKWFVEAAFKYAAAQWINPYNFYQHTNFETSTKTMMQKTLSLQKLYYHQIPLSINYTIRSNWSVGVGGMFNQLYSTIIEDRTLKTDVITHTSIEERQIKSIKGFTDSFFYASQFHLLMQTEYVWKNLSLGLRYSRGVQPYIQYTTPSGEVKTEIAQSLQFMLRLRLGNW